MGKAGQIKKHVRNFLKADTYNKRVMIQLVLQPIFQKKAFKHIGVSSCIYKPICVIGKKYISMGNHSHIMDLARIEMITEWRGKYHYSPELIIGHDVHFGQSLHLTCAQKIEIGDRTTISGDVCITDIEHEFSASPEKSVLDMPLITKPVKIGKNCLLGIGSAVLSGVTIGDNVIVGAHSVVTKDIESFSVVVGSPARVVKKYDFEKKEWIKV